MCAASNPASMIETVGLLPAPCEKDPVRALRKVVTPTV
jgi:hypothetical protein